MEHLHALVSQNAVMVSTIILIVAYIFIANTIFKAIIGLFVLSFLSIALNSCKITLFQTKLHKF